MKKYTKPTVNVVELQAKENIAANPLSVTQAEDSNGTITTTYNLSLLSSASVNETDV
jgi:hypothetical protein